MASLDQRRKTIPEINFLYLEMQNFIPIQNKIQGKLRMDG